MKILVTGAGGLLGGYIVDNLLGHGHAVVGYDLDAPKAAIPYVTGNILDLDALNEAAHGMDAIVHVAAAANIHSGTPETIFDVNVKGSWNVFEASTRSGVQRVVLCSSDSVMGNTVWKEHFWKPDYLPVDEAHPVRPTDPYGLSKLLSEEAGCSFAARGTLEVIALRPVFILFPSMIGEVEARHADSQAYSGPCAGGHVAAGGGLCWHHIDPEDVAEAFHCALTADYNGFAAYYLAANSTLHPKTTVDRVLSFFGTPVSVRKPDWYELNPHAPMFDTTKAQRDLGWNPDFDHRALIFGTGDIRG